MSKQDGLRYEDWKREQAKYIIEEKYQVASDLLSHAFRNPMTEPVKDAYKSIQDYLISIPLQQSDKRGRNIIDELLKRLDDISDAIYGDPEDDRVQAIRERFGIKREEVKISSIRVEHQLTGYQDLLRELRDIHLQAGYFGTSIGLRLTLHKQRKHGFEMELGEEHFDDGDQ